MRLILKNRCAGFVVAAVASSGIGMGSIANAADLTPLNASVESRCSIDVANKTMEIVLDITLPTQGRDNNWNYSDLESIDKVEVYRSVNYSPTLIETFGTQTPGATLTFSESEGLVPGQEYTYQIWTYAGEKYSTTYVYSVLYGLNIIGPDENGFILSASEDDKSVRIEVTCPEELMRKGYYGSEPLPEGVHFTALCVYKKDASGDEVSVKTFENPVSGKLYECEDIDIVNGNNKYYCRVETDFGVSDEISKTIFMGKDFPGKVGNLRATLQNDGVMVSWSEPDAYNGGKFDVSEVTYTVSRRENSGDWKVIADKISELQYFDNLEDVLAECNLYYRVVPENGVDPDGVNNAAETSNEIIAGPAAPLPFAETFNRYANWQKNFDNRIEADFNYNSFATPSIGYDQSVKLSDETTLQVYCGVGGPELDNTGEPDNFYIVKPSMWGSGLAKGYLTSGNISFDGVSDPVLSFYYVPIDGSTGTVTIEMLDAGADGAEFIPVQTVGYSYETSAAEQAPAEGQFKTEAEDVWKRCNVSLKDYALKSKVKFRVAFQYASTDNRHPMYLDHITIGNYPPVSNLQSKLENDKVVLTWDEPVGATSNDVSYEIFMNKDFSTPVATTQDTEYTFENLNEPGVTSFGVKAVYGDGGEAVEIPETTLDIESGVGSIIEGNVISVRYFNLDGTAATGNEPKTILIKETGFIDGTVLREKVVR